MILHKYRRISTCIYVSACIKMKYIKKNTRSAGDDFTLCLDHLSTFYVSVFRLSSARRNFSMKRNVWRSIYEM